MSDRTARRLAGSVGRLLRHVFPESQSGWVRAMRSEIEQVEDDRAALRFALGCLWGGFRQAAARRLFSHGQGVAMMKIKLRHPRNAGIACALAATALGIAYLVAAGAPARDPLGNAAAVLLGIVALGGLGGARVQARVHSGPLLLALGSCLLATALAGASAQGVSRWIWIGPLSVQVSLVVLPAMVVAFARGPTSLGSVGMGVAAVALALQHDRAMAGTLALGLAILTIARPRPASVGALIVALAAFAVALARPDDLPAVPFVDRILFTSFDVHPLAGAAVLLGALLLLVPSILGRRDDPVPGNARWVFGAVWLGCIVSAALGNYPTPVVGYGGSAILGYLLSLSCLPADARSARGRAETAAQADAGTPSALPRGASLA
jgi:hypothetical protein